MNHHCELIYQRLEFRIAWITRRDKITGPLRRYLRWAMQVMRFVLWANDKTQRFGAEAGPYAYMCGSTQCTLNDHFNCLIYCPHFTINTRGLDKSSWTLTHSKCRHIIVFSFCKVNNLWAPVNASTRSRARQYHWFTHPIRKQSTPNYKKSWGGWEWKGKHHNSRSLIQVI